MSSVVKKSARFIPKLKKQATRKKPAALPTPPSTQKQASDSLADEASQGASEAFSGSESPAATQINNALSISSEPGSKQEAENFNEKQLSSHSTPSVTFNFSLNKKADTGPLENNIAPEVAVSSDDEQDYEDNDLFRTHGEEPNKKVRRQSSVNIQRRLSGITPPIMRSRSGSISVSGGHGGSSNVTGNETYSSQGPMPVKIGIPISKPSKRRRSSVVRNKRNSILETSNVAPIPVSSSSSSSFPSAISILPPSIPINTSPTQSNQKSKVSIPSVSNEDIDQSLIDQDNSMKREKIAKLLTNDNDKMDMEETNKRAINTKEVKQSGSHASGKGKPASKNVRKQLQEQEGVKLIESVDSMTEIPRSFRTKNPDELDEITISEEKMTIAELCQPGFFIGKPGSRYKQVEEAKKHIEQLKKDRRRARMDARIQKKSMEEIMGEVDEPVKTRDFMSEKDVQPSQSTLQIKLVDGAFQLDQDSTNVDRHVNVSSMDRDREEANPFNNPITSASYSKRKYTDRWTPDEIEQFYQALSTWGTDFTLIAQLFPYRTRKQIKSKFNLEERKHPEIVEMALRRQLPANFKQYCADTNKEFKTLEDYNKELKELRIKHEQDMTQYREDRERAKKEDLEVARNKEIIKRTGGTEPLRRTSVKKLRDNEVVVGSIDDRKRHKIETS